MAAVRKLASPRITAPSLSDLTAADPETVRAGEDLDGARIADADLSDLRLTAVTWAESELNGATMRGTHLRGCRILDVRLDRLDASDLVTPGTKWRDSEIVSSRLGAVGLYDAAIDSLRITASKIGFLNLRGSVVNDLVVEDCPIEELDLSGARVTRATFTGCSIDTLTVRETMLRHVDLRGARLDRVEPVTGLRGAALDMGQVVDLAPALALGLGIEIV